MRYGVSLGFIRLSNKYKFLGIQTPSSFIEFLTEKFV